MSVTLYIDYYFYSIGYIEYYIIIIEFLNW